MLELGTIAPNFNLMDTTSHNFYSFSDLKGENGTVVMFICNHCPFVIHVAKQISETAKLFINQGVGFMAISSNDIDNYPLDRPELMTSFANEYDFVFPYLYDETQEVAKAYDAACTPDFYLFDSQDKLVYRGQLDGSRPQNGVSVTGEDLETAISNIVNNEPISILQKPSIGCNIKWKN